jgi:hypothetical protein
LPWVALRFGGLDSNARYATVPISTVERQVGETNEEFKKCTFPFRFPLFTGPARSRTLIQPLFANPVLELSCTNFYVLTAVCPLVRYGPKTPRAANAVDASLAVIDSRVMGTHADTAAKMGKLARSSANAFELEDFFDP